MHGHRLIHPGHPDRTVVRHDLTPVLHHDAARRGRWSADKHHRLCARNFQLFDKRRGLFIGINSAGIGLGFALAPQICSWAASIGGWRAGYFSLGLFLLFFVLPTVYLFLIDKPEDVGLLPDGVQKSATGDQATADTNGHLSLSEALRTRVFWIMLIIITCIAFSLNGLFSQLAPMLTDRGIDMTTAALVVSTMGISMAVARVVVGYIIDKLFAPRVALVVFLSVLFGVGLLIYGQHSVSVY